MNEKLFFEIQDEQYHGRQKYGRGPHDLEHDDSHSEVQWMRMINDHNMRAFQSTPVERRQHLLKLAGLAVSAIEAFDRQLAKSELPPLISDKDVNS